MAGLSGEPCVLNHFIEDFIIQESSWPFTVKGQAYEFGKLPTDEPEIITPIFYESENDVFSDARSSDEYSSEGSYEMDSCSYCGRTCTAMARHIENKKFCSSTCAKLFGVPLPKKGFSVANRGKGKWKHNYHPNRMRYQNQRKMSSSYYTKRYEVSTQVDEDILRDAVDGQEENEDLECLWKFEYVPASRWSVQEVAAFVRGVSGCNEYAESFISHEIDGFALMLVKEEHLVVGLKMKLGPALKLVGRVNQMKADAFDETEIQRAQHLKTSKTKPEETKQNGPITTNDTG